jgi:cytochrome c-type biogenesis protein
MKRLAAMAILLAGACSQPASFGRVGDPAPDYRAVNLAGDSVSLAGLRGQVVLLNVWATWCIPCRKEIPELQALHQEYEARGLRVVGVSVDDGNADADVRDFIQRYGVTYAVLRDPAEQVSTAFFVPGVPATFLIDRRGTIAWRRLGPFTTSDPGLQSALRQVL